VELLLLRCPQVNHILACAELYFSCRSKLQNEQRMLQQHLKETAASTELLLSGACGCASSCQQQSAVLDVMRHTVREHAHKHVIKSLSTTACCCMNPPSCC
jgi:hypothetical protein